MPQQQGRSWCWPGLHSSPVLQWPLKPAAGRCSPERRIAAARFVGGVAQGSGGDPWRRVWAEPAANATCLGHNKARGVGHGIGLLSRGPVRPSGRSRGRVVRLPEGSGRGAMALAEGNLTSATRAWAVVRHGCRRRGDGGASGRNGTSARWPLRSGAAHRRRVPCRGGHHHRTSRDGCGRSCTAGAPRPAAPAAPVLSLGRGSGHRAQASPHLPKSPEPTLSRGQQTAQDAATRTISRTTIEATLPPAHPQCIRVCVRCGDCARRAAV